MTRSLYALLTTTTTARPTFRYGLTGPFSGDHCRSGLVPENLWRLLVQTFFTCRMPFLSCNEQLKGYYFNITLYLIKMYHRQCCYLVIYASYFPIPKEMLSTVIYMYSIQCIYGNHLRQGGDVFIGVSSFVRSLVRLLAGLRKNCSNDFHKISWKVEHGPRKKSLDFGGHPNRVLLDLDLDNSRRRLS